jgi:hypothetical protein
MVIPEIQASILDILDMGITTHYGYRVGVINFVISLHSILSTVLYTTH